MSKKHTLEKFGTDVGRLKNMKDEDIDFSDIPPVTEEMFKDAMLRKNLKPIPKKIRKIFQLIKTLSSFSKRRVLIIR